MQENKPKLDSSINFIYMQGFPSIDKLSLNYQYGFMLKVLILKYTELLLRIIS